MTDTTHQPNILVTGGAGYLGSALIRELTKHRNDRTNAVRILDNMQNGGHSALLDIPGDGTAQFVEGDLLDASTLRLSLTGIDTIVHLAALTHTPFSFENPTWLEQVNHWATANLVDRAVEAGVQKFILASTAAVYGPGGPFTEQDPCRPTGPYAQSKLNAEHVVLESEARGMHPIVLRYGTLFGVAPTMRFDAVINRFCYLAGVGRPLTIHGTGGQRRPAMHVDDAARLIVELLSDTPSPGTILNAATGNPSVEEVKDAILAAKPNTRFRYTEQDILSYLSLEMDSSQLIGHGFEPRYDLISGVSEVLSRFTGFTPMTYGE